MSDFSAEHASAYTDVESNGAPLTFSSLTTSYDPATDTHGEPVETTVPGVAIQTKGDPGEYAALGLVESEAPTLFFVPRVLGQLPPLQSTTVWNGVPFAVHRVYPLAPNGVAIAARLVVIR